MAKSIRSKKMRKNRSALRKTVSEPIAEKRRQILAKKLEASIMEKKGQTILGLKSVFGTNSGNQHIPCDKTPSAECNDEQEVDSEVEEMDQDIASTKGKDRVKLLKKKGSKSNRETDKKLVWFS
mmetsp:Transcript_13471/g.20254  ORF Transcript_13471/g.20254 Transcript_13471/m.20254 type:complete len:124 (+) Transcript_13471:78-449(+)|eukprot:CAMPEP_0185023268 /NCGR_PEP_ID=MMETSP1103-20130426/5958_1 /TAXON_ID=36769 /ORGANISM="Paraphysomonas bandaiensis, Strain Caron Lab Isolate" /LENGTH=123 /DNA_ID=CAMNT_0027555775 /DNA_START=40 /DNA_END=411 /DNA_ORIENTATION=+